MQDNSIATVDYKLHPSSPPENPQRVVHSLMILDICTSLNCALVCHNSCKLCQEEATLVYATTGGPYYVHNNTPLILVLYVHFTECRWQRIRTKEQGMSLREIPSYCKTKQVHTTFTSVQDGLMVYCLKLKNIP